MNTLYKKLANISDIPDVPYLGYIWLSDENKPRTVTCLSDIAINKSQSYIVEGELISTDDKISVSLRDAGDGLRIYQYDLESINRLDDNQKSETSLLALRLDKIEKLKFITVWLPEADSECEGMEVLKPAMRVFNGFEFKK